MARYGGTKQMDGLQGNILLKWMILRYPYVRKPPYPKNSMDVLDNYGSDTVRIRGKMVFMEEDVFIMVSFFFEEKEKEI